LQTVVETNPKGMFLETEYYYTLDSLLPMHWYENDCRLVWPDKKQSPEGSRLLGFYFRLHPLMSGERGGENTSDVLIVHYCDRWIVFGRQDAVDGWANSWANFLGNGGVIRGILEVWPLNSKADPPSVPV
jgi:hypothetical protein